MHKNIITFSLIILITIIGNAQSEKIEIKSDDLIESNYLKADDFYLTHYLYIDLFLRENLFLDASSDDVSAIIKAIKKYVTPETALEIEIEKPGKRNYLIKVSILKKDDGTELLIAFTNWSVKEKKFENEIKIENDSYTRWYFLNGDKMTYRKDMSDQRDYSSMNSSDLANAYLFDELSENDETVKSLLNENLNKKDLSLSESIMDNLILLKYFIFEKDDKNVRKQTEYINDLFDSSESKSDLRGLEVAFDATKFQIKILE